MYPRAAFTPGLGVVLDSCMGFFPYVAKIFQKNSLIFKKTICISEKNEYN